MGAAFGQIDQLRILLLGGASELVNIGAYSESRRDVCHLVKWEKSRRSDVTLSNKDLRHYEMTFLTSQHAKKNIPKNRYLEPICR